MDDLILYREQFSQTEISFCSTKKGRFENFIINQEELNLALNKINFSNQLSELMEDKTNSSFLRDKKMTQLIKSNKRLFDKIDEEKILYSNKYNLNLHDHDFPMLKSREILINYSYVARDWMQLLTAKLKLDEDNKFLNNACRKLKMCLSALDQKYSE